MALMTSRLPLIEDVVDSVPDALVLVDGAGTIVDVNARVETLFGYRRAELIGQSVEVLLPARFRDSHRRHRGEYAHSPSPRPMCDGLGLLGLRQDGTEFELAISLNSLEVGGAPYFLASIRDAAEWTAYEAAREWEHLRTAFATSSAVVAAISGPDLRYEWILDPHPDFRPEDSLGRRDDEIHSGAGIADLMDLKQSVLDHDEPERRTITFARSNGYRTYDIAATPLHDGDGHVVGVTTLAVDVSELHRLVRFQREFMSAVAHDLRNPLTVIRGQAERLLRRSGAHASELQDIMGASAQLERMIEDLLDSSALESGNLHIEREEVELEDVLNEATRTASMLSDRHSILLRPIGHPLRICCDRLRLQQVLGNLLENAIKYSPDGGQIGVTLRDLESEASISIRDQGLGIPHEEADTIFRAFGRTSVARTFAVPGTGLGLSIAKGLVQAHGGRIWAESDGAGKGSTFSFTLPIGPCSGAQGEQITGRRSGA